MQYACLSIYSTMPESRSYPYFYFITLPQFFINTINPKVFENGDSIFSPSVPSSTDAHQFLPCSLSTCISLNTPFLTLYDFLNVLPLPGMSSHTSLMKVAPNSPLRTCYVRRGGSYIPSSVCVHILAYMQHALSSVHAFGVCPLSEVPLPLLYLPNLSSGKTKTEITFPEKPSLNLCVE